MRRDPCVAVPSIVAVDWHHRSHRYLAYLVRRRFPGVRPNYTSGQDTPDLATYLGTGQHVTDSQSGLDPEALHVGKAICSAVVVLVGILSVYSALITTMLGRWVERLTATTD